MYVPPCAFRFSLCPEKPRGEQQKKCLPFAQSTKARGKNETEVSCTVVFKVAPDLNQFRIKLLNFWGSSPQASVTTYKSTQTPKVDPFAHQVRVDPHLHPYGFGDTTLGGGGCRILPPTNGGGFKKRWLSDKGGLNPVHRATKIQGFYIYLNFSRHCSFLHHCKFRANYKEGSIGASKPQNIFLCRQVSLLGCCSSEGGDIRGSIQMEGFKFRNRIGYTNAEEFQRTESVPPLSRTPIATCPLFARFSPKVENCGAPF